ncbi:MAG: hypothetical protein WAV41_04260 [Microgenomates group bacterium]
MIKLYRKMLVENVPAGREVEMGDGKNPIRGVLTEGLIDRHDDAGSFRLRTLEVSFGYVDDPERKGQIFVSEGIEVRVPVTLKDVGDILKTLVIK